jgi:hypothetical protein
MRWLLSSLSLAGFIPLLAGINTPAAGAVLRGTVTITGSNQVESGQFLSSELAFAYTGDATGTWFLIGIEHEIIGNGTLGTWDTTSITDGDYSLRLRIYLQDGSTMDVTVTDLHVRNDLPPPTATPLIAAQDLPTLEPTAPAATPAPLSVTPAFTARPTLPGNPIALSDDSVLSTFRRGAVFAVIAIALTGLFCGSSPVIRT